MRARPSASASRRAASSPGSAAAMRRLVVARVKYRATDGQGDGYVDDGAGAPRVLSRAAWPRRRCWPTSSVTSTATGCRSIAGGPLRPRRLPSRPRHDVPLARGRSAATARRDRRRRDARARRCAPPSASPPTRPASLVQPIRTQRAGPPAGAIAATSSSWSPTPTTSSSSTSRRRPARSIGEMFRGFSGYVQADAKSVYDLLFRPRSDRPTTTARPTRRPHRGRLLDPLRGESSGRPRSPRARRPRGARSASAASSPLDDGCATVAPTSATARLRDAHLSTARRRLLRLGRGRVRGGPDQRGSLRSALGYVVRQKDALTRFLDDGRLAARQQPLRARAPPHRRRPKGVALRRQRRPRRRAAGNLFSLIASARLHRLDPEAYLRDVIPRACPLAARTATSSSPPSTGPRLAPASTPPSSPPRSATSPSRRRSPRDRAAGYALIPLARHQPNLTSVAAWGTTGFVQRIRTGGRPARCA